MAKLAILVGTDRKINHELVSANVGGSRTTAWDMLDAALNGNVRNALVQLDRLLASGEQPVGLLGQIAASLRRLAAATQWISQAEAAGRRTSLRDALEQVGVRSFVLQKAERQLRQLGSRRGEQLDRWLLQADMDIQGRQHDAAAARSRTADDPSCRPRRPAAGRAKSALDRRTVGRGSLGRGSSRGEAVCGSHGDARQTTGSMQKKSRNARLGQRRGRTCLAPISSSFWVGMFGEEETAICSLFTVLVLSIILQEGVS